MTEYMQLHGEDMIKDLQQQHRDHPNASSFRSSYGGQAANVDYPALISKLQMVLPEQRKGPAADSELASRTTAGGLTSTNVKSTLRSNGIQNRSTFDRPASSSQLKRKKSTSEAGSKNQPIDLDDGPVQKPKKAVAALEPSHPKKRKA